MALRLLSLRAAALLLSAASIIACSKKSDDATPTPAATTPAPTTCTVNGAAFTSAVSAAGLLPGNSARPLVIYSSTDTTQARPTSITLFVPARTGTFAITPDTTSTAQALYIENGTGYFGVSGNVVVTTYAPSTTAGASNVAGTFSFTATELNTTKTVSNGKFNIKY